MSNNKTKRLFFPINEIDKNKKKVNKSHKKPYYSYQQNSTEAFEKKKNPP